MTSTNAHESRTAKEFFASVLTDDAARSYAGADYELILVRVMLCLSDLLVHSCQTEGDAYAYVLQVGEKQEQGIGSAVAVTLAAHPDIIRRELAIPDELAIVIGIALGRPDPDSPQNRFRSTRRSAGEVVRMAGF